ncbi:uncharacterized protein RSE6_10063 [Rhynchosporium secalis]|uniref:Uncharacterized protein n=1 Tax=Rhynchosporium secalis TaxID=38038 RepID=A0A1E1MJJ0_RHYSE|nr:uncharacterized protein RSE6_10063 [Rhynchosporium secalis]
MASAISLTTRPVLGDLNANTPLGRGAEAMEGGKSISPNKPGPLAASLSEESLPESTNVHSVPLYPSLLAAKRKIYLGDVPTQQDAKRLKETGDAGETRQTVQQSGGELHEFLQVNPQQRNRGGELGRQGDHTNEPTSPASSCTSLDDSALNDSQLTNITIPDDNILPPRPFLTREQLRQKAREVKLRLSLASYKVRTNQIDIPISRLEIRSSTTSSRIPPLPRSTTQSSQAQQATRPSSAPQVPYSSFQGPSAEIKQAQQATIYSSPPARCSTQELSLASPTKSENHVSRAGFATPLLPRQQQGLLNPPSLGGSPSWEERGNELTSSVVKGRAADGLLSLMRQS